MATKQYFGIKYPFTAQDFQHFFVDANSSLSSKAKSQLMHLVFTPKGQRLRNPEYGTDLIRYIFDQNDNETWESVKTEIKEAVTRWIGNIKLNDIQIVQSKDDEHEIFVRLDYTVSDGNKSTSDSVIVQL